MPCQICCTSKLLTEFRLKSNQAPKPEEGNSIGTWYAHLFYLAGKKCVVMMNAASGYCVVGLFMSRAEIQQIPELIRLDLLHLMKEDGFTEAQISKVQEEIRDSIVCRTNDRTAVSFLSRYILDITYHAGDEHVFNGLQLARMLNHSPSGPAWSPVKAFQNVIDGIPVEIRKR